MSDLRQALESALGEDADDLAAYSAYADYLAEQGDPRGEYIQLQLALEGEVGNRGELRRREAELFERHGREWLGEAGKVLIGPWSGSGGPIAFTMSRGRLDSVRLLPGPIQAVRAVVGSPAVRLLRRLEIVYDMRYHPSEFDEFLRGPSRALGIAAPEAIRDTDNALGPVSESPYLEALRSLKVGYSDAENPPRHSSMAGPSSGFTAAQLLVLLGKCPRLEELAVNASIAQAAVLFAHPSLGRLRSLQYFFGYGERAGPTSPMAALAGNPSLRLLTALRIYGGDEWTYSLADLEAVVRSPNLPALTHLRFGFTAFGDEGARVVVESGILKRLKHLDLGSGNVTDAGARLLAACPDLRELEFLGLSHNALTDEGIAALRRTGIRFACDGQHADDDLAYLAAVDVE